MKILGQTILQNAAKRHANAAGAIVAWLAIVKSAKWSNFVQLRKDFPSADYVRPYTIFNIRGNAYRLIAVIDYAENMILVRNFITHAEYDKENWK